MVEWKIRHVTNNGWSFFYVCLSLHFSVWHVHGLVLCDFIAVERHCKWPYVFTMVGGRSKLWNVPTLGAQHIGIDIQKSITVNEMT